MNMKEMNIIYCVMKSGINEHITTQHGFFIKPETALFIG